MMQWLHKILINKLWRRFFFLALMMQLSLTLFAFGYGGQLMATRLVRSVETIAVVADVVARHNDSLLMKQVITELTKNNYTVKFGQIATDKTLEAPTLSTLATKIGYIKAILLRPSLAVFTKTLEDLCKDCFTVSYQNDPPMIWLQNKHPPYVNLGATLIGQKLFFWQFIIFLVMGFLSAIGMAWWVNKRITQPLNKLSNHALNIVNERRVNNINVEPGSLSEVAILATALNKMHDDINRLLVERELFLAEISHDLRTPLSRLSIAVQMQEAQPTKYTEGMLADIKEMSVIIDQTMELAHVNNVLNEVWVEDDVNKLLVEIKAKYLRAGIYLDLDLSTMPTLSFKNLALTRLFYNLIDNALKYGSGEVLISSVMEGFIPTIYFVNPVRDCNDDTDTTLKSVNSLSDSLTSGRNKLGLGIIKRITEMHNIALAITNDQETKIYRVTLSFMPVY